MSSRITIRSRWSLNCMLYIVLINDAGRTCYAHVVIQDLNCCGELNVFDHVRRKYIFLILL